MSRKVLNTNSKRLFTLITRSVRVHRSRAQGLGDELTEGGKCGYPLLDGTLPIDNASQLDFSSKKTTAKKQLRSCIMDDHLLLNLRTVCSRHVSVGEMKISYFLHFFYPSPSTMATSESAEDGGTSAGDKRKKEKKKSPKTVRFVGTGRRRATTSGTFPPSVTNDGVFAT